jgi:biopolymer transport protein TolQ
MRSFTAIAGANNTSLAVVAPGIARSAVCHLPSACSRPSPPLLAYNRLTMASTGWKPSSDALADRFHATLSRELEVEVATGH